MYLTAQHIHIRSSKSHCTIYLPLHFMCIPHVHNIRLTMYSILHLSHFARLSAQNQSWNIHSSTEETFPPSQLIGFSES